jgi:transposase InsO family protein
VNELQQSYSVSERRACQVVDQPRSSQRYIPQVPDDEPRLIADMLQLVREFPRYGYRLVTHKLRQQGWTVNAKRVYRLWCREGLKVPKKHRKTRHSGQHENGCDHHRSDHPDDVWAWDFVFDRTSNGTMLKWFAIVDEYTRECLCLHVDRNIKSDDVINELAKLFATRGLPNHIRSDNGSEFTASVIRTWLEKLELEVLYVEPGSPWENGYVESFNSRLRDEFLSLEEFENLRSARSLTASFRHDYNELRPHSSLGYMTPNDFASQWPASAQSAALPSLQQATAATQTQPLTQPVLS